MYLSLLAAPFLSRALMPCTSQPKASKPQCCAWTVQHHTMYMRMRL